MISVTPASDAVRFKLPYVPRPKQQEFHRCPAKYRLFGGAAGPGKSWAILFEGIIQALEFGNVNTLLLRRTFAELEKSLLLTFRREVPRELYRSFKESPYPTVTWHNGSTTQFGYCKSEKDVYQYQGAEFLFIGFDELTLFTLPQWQFLTTRNRCPVPGTFSNMAGATNPGNIGHAWVKCLWGCGSEPQKPPPGMERPELYDPSEYAFIRARIEDNPTYANDAEYRKTLEKLPTHLRKAMLEGDWDIFAGQYFDIFRMSKHVIEPEDIAIQPWWQRWISIDWGHVHNTAVHWHTTEPAKTEPGERKGHPRRTVTYREFVHNYMSPRVAAGEIIEAHKLNGEAEPPPVVIYISPDARDGKTYAEGSIEEQFGDVFAKHGWPRPTLADNDRVGGWMLWYQLMQGLPVEHEHRANVEIPEYGEPEWVCTSNCRNLIEVIPTLTYDPIDINDIEKRDGDDSADDVRYGLKSHLKNRSVTRPLALRVAERVTAKDPTSRAMQALKAVHEETRSGGPVYARRRRRPPHRW